MEDAQAVICATGFSGLNVINGVASVNRQGTINLVDAAKVVQSRKREREKQKLWLEALFYHLPLMIKSEMSEGRHALGTSCTMHACL